MARVKRSVHSKKKRRDVLEAAKGYRGARHKRYRVAKEQLLHSGVYAYRDRRDKKGNFRRLWITRIGAASRQNGMSYSTVHGRPEGRRGRARPQGARGHRRERPEGVHRAWSRPRSPRSPSNRDRVRFQSVPRVLVPLCGVDRGGSPQRRPATSSIGPGLASATR